MSNNSNFKKSVGVYIASDHAGWKLKQQLVAYFRKAKIDYEDVGPFKYAPADDYPDYAFKLAIKVVKAKAKGILICRNGIGVCIAANKVKGIRAVSTTDPAIAKTARADDDTNVLCLGQDFVSLAQARKVISVWRQTQFSGGARHRRRLAKIKKFETKN